MRNDSIIADLSERLKDELLESEIQSRPLLRVVPNPAFMLGVGLHYGIDEDRYHSDPCIVPSLSASTAKLLCERSPEHAHYFHPRLGGNQRAPKKEWDRGHLVHALLLGRGKDIAIIEAGDFPTKPAP